MDLWWSRNRTLGNVRGGTFCGLFDFACVIRYLGRFSWSSWDDNGTKAETHQNSFSDTLQLGVTRVAIYQEPSRILKESTRTAFWERLTKPFCKLQSTMGLFYSGFESLSVSWYDHFMWHIEQSCPDLSKTVWGLSSFSFWNRFIQLSFEIFWARHWQRAMWGARG